MPSQAYLKCTNSGCGKLNPVDPDAKPSDEYTCVFCGQIFRSPVKASADNVDNKKRNRGKKPMHKESRPENRNMRKPMV